MILQALYTLGIRLYGLGIWLASLRSIKARRWVKGRASWAQNLQANIQTQGAPWIWFHCASLGEFEQARNLIDELYDHHPEFRVLVTFYSPSGYEIRQSYSKCHHVAYLPLDTPSNAKRFFDIVTPAFAVFVKYELWLNILAEAQSRALKLILVSARPDPEGMSLAWPMRKLFRKGYLSFAHIFTQDDSSATLLRSLGHPSVSVSADTRFDRVASNQSQRVPILAIEQWLGGKTCMVAGSTWPTGDQLLMDAWQALPDDLRPRMIIAPHEIHPDQIDRWVDEADGKAIRYRDIDQISDQHEILWIDCIGLLSGLYAYADIAYVGGAFDRGLHNILEAAVYGCSLIVGPKFRRFPEAQDLIEAGGCTSVKNLSEMTSSLNELLRNSETRKNKAGINRAYIHERVGATQKVLDWMRSQDWIGERNEAPSRS